MNVTLYRSLRFFIFATVLALGGCTTQEAYKQYRAEFKAASVPAGSFRLMTGDPSLSGDLYYVVATKEADAWSYRLSRSPVRRTAANQELFELDAKTMRIKPLFSGGSSVAVVPDKYQTVLCPPAFMATELAKTHYSVCTTAFSGSLGSVRWDEMAQMIASLGLEREVNKIKANAQAAADRAARAKDGEAKTRAEAARRDATRRAQALRQARIGTQIRCNGIATLSCPNLPGQTSLREFIDAGSASTGFWQLVSVTRNGAGTVTVVHRKVRAKQQPAPLARAAAPSQPAQAVSRCVNPATGLPMRDPSGACGGYDVQGNLYGEDNNKPLYIPNLPGFDPHWSPVGPKTFH